LSEGWQGTDSDVCAEVVAQARANLEAYRVNPALLEEQVNIELAAAEGGYGRRQLYELAQNGADALIDDPGGRIEVMLTDGAFYCANQGEPIDVPGVRAILLSNVSQKRGDEIGRFGLGFKSVLEVTDSPEFYSRSGSFAWNYERARREIGDVVHDFDPETDAAPRLRLAWPVDPWEAFERDEQLRSLAEWATTIVKLPFHSDDVGWLADDVAGFPREFLLFCRHVAKMVLDNRSMHAPAGDDLVLARRREIEIEKLEKPRGFWRLVEGEEKSVWTVFSAIHVPSDAAQRDAGVMSKRERIPIHWALPVAGRTGPGVLWAFFPTEYETTLSGIVNAPWKTNPDRKNLLEGAFNREVLGVVARLVIDSLQTLRDSSDPGRLLDLIPARGDEARNWADRELTNRFYEIASKSPSLPDLKGALRRPDELCLHPNLMRPGEEGRATAQRLLTQWSEAASNEDWCHPSIERRERRPRVERLIKDGGGTLVGWPAWLEALVEPPSVAGSKAAVAIAAEASENGLVTRPQIDSSDIVLTLDGHLVPPNPEDIFFAGDYDAAEDIDYVHPDLAADSDAREALERLGIAAVDAAADLEGLLRGANFNTWTDSDWDEFWSVVRRLEPERAAGILKARKRRPFVRVRSGRFRPFRSALLPGPIVPDDAERDRDSVVDVAYHGNDLELLRDLGAVGAPEPRLGGVDEPWFDQYRQETLVDYRRRLTGARRPREDLLDFLSSDFAGPLTAVEALSEEGRALFTDAALAAESDLEPWKFAHMTQREVYPVMEVDPPVVWRLKREGYFRTSCGLRPIAETVAPSLSEWGAVLPVADVDDHVADRFALPRTLDDLSTGLWSDALAAVETLDRDGLIGRLYAEACKRVDAPARIRCRVGEGHALEAPEFVTVVHEVRELNALVPQKVPTLLVPTAAAGEELRDRWRLSAEQKVETTLAYGAAGAATPLSDRFPALQWQIEPDKASLTLIPCSELRLETITAGGRLAEDLDFYVDDGKVYFDAALTNREVLMRLGPVVGFDADDRAVDEILARGADVERRRRVSEVRQKPTLEARLLAAVGEANLRSRLPKGLLAVLEEGGSRLAGQEVAELALAVYGVDVLRNFRNELHEQGLQPPSQWAASAAALSFVRRLGFPREFAGFVQPGRSPLLEVEGPPNVPDLHDFQRAIVGEFRSLLRAEGDGRRALLSLPTGAGKTRVAVEALIEAIQHDGLEGPILWVTQSDELCEQAVQTWSFVWRGLGPPRARLAITRLWATNEAEPVDGATQIVVATIQKLQASVIADSDYDWLANAGCVVVDEAHHSTAPTYTDLLAWLGLERGRGTRPLVGLTATPFRGVSEEESRRLVARYGGRRLDMPAFGDEDPYPILQERGILAHVQHRVLAGAEIELTREELRMLERTRLFPRSAEDQLGLNVERNRRLLEEIRRLPSDWTVLFFATSVDHAQTMAALLTLEGITAKPITGLTDPGPRRHYIEEFREGRLRVLTNYAVLTQGFDAPAVRAIFVARPTYSPNLYQQMIGRGLRGPLNGGKEECLIVNVEDNVRQFGEQLAFRDFEYLWNSA
jgi:superfamily II DNA or RNA helicase